jgi:hypothetical protein
VEWLQSNLGSNIVGGLVVAVVVALFGTIPRLRRPILSALHRFWSWVLTVRVSTTTRIEAEIDRRSTEATEQAVAAFTGTDVEDELIWTESATRELFSTAEPAQPRPRPRWFIAPVHADTDTTKIYLIKNLAPDMTLSDVRLEHPDGKVVFHDAAAWAQLRSGEEVGFRATYSYHFGFLSTLDVAWTDEHGRRDGERVQLFTGLYATHSLWETGASPELP